MKVTNQPENIKEIVESTNLSHIAIIMDGNRRWAKEKFLPSAMGHKKGVDSLKEALKSCHEFGIKYLTVYAFSTENWNRPDEEVAFLMNLLAQTIKNELNDLNDNSVKITFIGDLSKLSPNLTEILKNAEKETKDNTGVNLQIAFNYGARNEIVNAMKSIATKIEAKELTVEDINSELISENLYTKNIPDPDLLIRTGGEMRISNYLLWQVAYCEIYITEKYWPDFDRQAMIDAILEFESRNRRFGK